MNDNQKWIAQKVTLGLVLLSVGTLALLAGVLIPLLTGSLDFLFRIIAGAGILSIGLGIAQLVKYRGASRDPLAARRITAQERDERMIAIRLRAGNRAFWVSLLMVYAGLMWLSFAGNGSLTAPSLDALWYYLAAATVIPLGVYVASIIRDNAHS